MSDSFGPFDTLFLPVAEGVATHLTLLDLRDAEVTIDNLNKAIAESQGKLSQHVKNMLRHRNWRVQLVAVSAMVLANLTDCLDELWLALERPCWISPQLAAAASIMDADFLARAKERLDQGCAVNTAEMTPMSSIVRHMAMGAASDQGHSAKICSALVALCSEDQPSWLSSLMAKADIQQLLAADIDSGGAIALSWKQEMVNTLARQAIAKSL